MQIAIRKQPGFYAGLVLPGVLIVSSLILYPLINGVYTSFTNTSPLFPDTRFVALDNYQFLVTESGFWESVGNTVLIVGVSIFGATSIAYLLALALNTGLRGAKFLRTAVFQIWVVPWIVIAILWAWLFSENYGLVNYIAIWLGFYDEPFKWLFHPQGSQWAVIMGYSWRSIPFLMVIILAALQGVPNDVNESAMIDGASFVQRQRLIVLPLIRNILVVAMLLQSVRLLQEITLVFVLTKGGPVNATMVLSLFTYKLAFEDWEFGLAAAAAILWLIMIMLLAVAMMKFVLRPTT